MLVTRFWNPPTYSIRTDSRQTAKGNTLNRTSSLRHVGASLILAIGLTNAACVAADPQPADPALERKGRIAFLLCRSCHTVAENEPHLTGPNLHGLFGAKPASKPDYEYSTALQEADIVWTAETLDAWLINPTEVLPGNKMAFAGMPSEDDRKALVAYLKKVTAK